MTARRDQIDLQAAKRWTDLLSRWGIPDEIQAQAPECPWSWPASRFKRNPDQIDTPSFRRALHALVSDATILDVGVGAGWASLPLAPPASFVTGIDRDHEMLQAFSAAATDQGVRHETVRGEWPHVTAYTDIAIHDVAVSHHVIFNVADLPAFAIALDHRTRHRVVLECTVRHPAGWLDPLWHHFHGLERPYGPTVHDAAAVLEDAGLDPHLETWDRSPWTAALERSEVIQFARRFLCLEPGRESEVDALLPPQPGTRDFATIWWDSR